MKAGKVLGVVVTGLAVAVTWLSSELDGQQRTAGKARSGDVPTQLPIHRTGNRVFIARAQL